jgi:hypothetical protein
MIERAESLKQVTKELKDKGKYMKKKAQQILPQVLG